MLLFLTLAMLILGAATCQAHKELIHEQIGVAAADSSEGLTRFANEILGGIEVPIHFLPFEETVSRPRPPRFWVGKGSFHQDYWPRWGNHFYTVKPDRDEGEARGLSDVSEGFLGILPAPTTNSYAWATVPEIITPKLWKPFHTPPPAENTDNWGKAREYQYDALTSLSKSTRDEKMARMFFSLGHILHLNQDSSQPDHVRDDAHPFRAHIENYGGKTYQHQPGAFNPVPHWGGWAYWRDQANFNKLLDFWDRGFYRGDAEPLDAEATGVAANKLGLAEFSNGNLLGENALYAEFFNPTDTHFFPFPSLKNTDQPQLKAGNWANHLDVTTLEDGTQGKRPYLEKLGAGQNVKHHAALKYLTAQNLGKMGTFPARAAVTLKDNAVLQDYHTIMIPKAIEYSAGILDYFFRGRISATVSGNTLAIRNDSGEPFKDGTFILLQEAADGTRTVLQSQNYTGILPDGGAFNMTLASPLSDGSKGIVVYQGTIGLTGNDASDTVDEGIAIATTTFEMDLRFKRVVAFATQFSETEFWNDAPSYNPASGPPYHRFPGKGWQTPRRYLDQTFDGTMSFTVPEHWLYQGEENPLVFVPAGEYTGRYHWTERDNKFVYIPENEPEYVLDGGIPAVAIVNNDDVLGTLTGIERHKEAKRRMEDHGLYGESVVVDSASCSRTHWTRTGHIDEWVYDALTDDYFPYTKTFSEEVQLSSINTWGTFRARLAGLLNAVNLEADSVNCVDARDKRETYFSTSLYPGGSDSVKGPIAGWIMVPIGFHGLSSVTLSVEKSDSSAVHMLVREGSLPQVAADGNFNNHVADFKKVVSGTEDSMTFPVSPAGEYFVVYYVPAGSADQTIYTVRHGNYETGSLPYSFFSRNHNSFKPWYESTFWVIENAAGVPVVYKFSEYNMEWEALPGVGGANLFEPPPLECLASSGTHCRADSSEPSQTNPMKAVKSAWKIPRSASCSHSRSEDNDSPFRFLTWAQFTVSDVTSNNDPPSETPKYASCRYTSAGCITTDFPGGTVYFNTPLQGSETWLGNSVHTNWMTYPQPLWSELDQFTISPSNYRQLDEIGPYNGQSQMTLRVLKDSSALLHFLVRIGQYPVIVPNDNINDDTADFRKVMTGTDDSITFAVTPGTDVCITLYNPSTSPQQTLTVARRVENASCCPDDRP